jgi:hypothetical protein
MTALRVTPATAHWRSVEDGRGAFPQPWRRHATNDVWGRSESSWTSETLVDFGGVNVPAATAQVLIVYKTVFWP